MNCFDVIAVHQMLKNAVPVPEYILMTNAIFSRSLPPVRERAQTVEQELEGLGKTEIYFRRHGRARRRPAASAEGHRHRASGDHAGRGVPRHAVPAWVQEATLCDRSCCTLGGQLISLLQESHLVRVTTS